MKILVYGAGVLGSLYAARLRRAGCDVSILARGERLADLQKHGVVLEHALSGVQEVTDVAVVEHLAPDDAYDYVIVLVRKNQVDSVLPILAANHAASNILFMVNNALGYDRWMEAVGRNRLLVGFPGAGGTREGHVVRYIVISGLSQPSTFGQVDAGKTERLVDIVAAIKRAGFPVTICRNMDAWQKTHVAWISPIANAVYMAGGDNYRLANMPEAVRLMIRAIREGFQVLRKLDVPITPSKFRGLLWMPEPLLVALLRRWAATEHCETVATRHANAAVDEMRLLAQEFQQLASSSGIPTPARDELDGYIPDDTAPGLHE
jgi:2-dehydropantoate 2-reductase